MKIRIALFLMLGLCYYGYVRSTTDLAMVRFKTFQSGYLDTIEAYSTSQN